MVLALPAAHDDTRLSFLEDLHHETRFTVVSTNAP
jgi:hypothetical protein